MEAARPEDPPAPPGTTHVPTWATDRLWPGWERDAFLGWVSLQGEYSPDPWAYFAEWWRIDGSWR